MCASTTTANLSGRNVWLRDWKKGAKSNCSRPFLIGFNLCCLHNEQELSPFTLEEVWPKKKNYDTIPRRLSPSGKSAGLPTRKCTRLNPRLPGNQNITSL